MMISPQFYVANEIEGESFEIICSKIRGLQSSIGHLKKRVENEVNSSYADMRPTPQTQISCMREYISFSREYLGNHGYDYPMSRTERKAKAFNDNLNHIKSITVEYGGYFEGAERRVISHDGEKIVVERFFFNGKTDDKKILYEDMTWSDFLGEVGLLYIGEWNLKYINPEVYDGTEWSLDIKYRDGLRSKHYEGINKYPYNFEQFMDVVQM